MPAFNAETTIFESISSILDQSYEDFELLVVDDCSSDNTKAIIESFTDPRIKLFKLPVNKGVAEARNTAIKHAQGKYITFLDADDTWLMDKLRTQYSYLENGYDLVYSAYTMTWPDKKTRTLVPPRRATYKKLLGGNFIGNLTGAYNSEKLGKFYQKAVGHEDYLMWLEIASTAESSMGIPIPLAQYRVGASSLSANKMKTMRWTWDIYRKHLALGVVRSSFCFIRYIFNASLKRL